MTIKASIFQITSGDHYQNYGAHEFVALPAIGELVNIGAGESLRVKAVTHVPTRTDTDETSPRVEIELDWLDEG